MSQTSFGIGKSNGMRPRSESAIAQALVNVANVAGVSSGRKISSSASPWKTLSESHITADSKEDLPPTYSTVTANIAKVDVSTDKPTGDKKNSVDLRFEEHASVNCGDLSETDIKETGVKCAGMENSHPSHHLGAEAMTSGTAESENVGQSLEHLLQLSYEHSLKDETATNGVPSESPTGKHKKRLSWFGKRQDSTTESESSSAAENEEETRRKIRWLWRSAVRKSRAQKNLPSKSEDDMPHATSLEKLKSG